MKKFLSVLITFYMLLSTALTCCAQSSRGISVQLDGKEISFDVMPQIISGRTMVPVRAIFEAMGATVNWDDTTRTATAVKDDTTVEMSLGSVNLIINGKTITMDVIPEVIDGRTLVPARYVAESFGYAVQWDKNSQTVKILSIYEPLITIHYIDVGQADAALVESGGQTLLIDGGNAAESNLIYSYLTDQNIDYLDYIIVSHVHEDHIGGLSGALTKAKAGTIYAPSYTSSADFYQSFINLLSEQGLSIQTPKTGETFTLGNAEVTLIVPSYEDKSNPNNTSIMAKIVCEDTSFLFTGDAETEEEDDILSQKVDLDSDVLKAAHHGGNTSSSAQFLDAVSPQYVVISAGRNNSYSHPDEETLDRFEQIGAQIYRTDLNGDIIINSDGKNLTITTQKSSASVNDEPTVTMYAADGRTITVLQSEVQAYKDVGWFSEPPVTLYAADGRTITVLQSEVQAYKDVGWFSEPPVTLYAADGRTITVAQSEVQAYKDVGWFSEPPVTLYAADGRTITVAQSEVQAYKDVGWFSEPPVTLYAADGRTITVAQSEVQAYKDVGWFSEPPVTLYAADGRTTQVPRSQVSQYQSAGWYTSPPQQESDAVQSGMSVYITPTGEKYHYSASCAGKNARKVTLSEAKSRGLTPCKKCT